VNTTQLILMIATPSFVVLVGILVNLVQISGLRGDIAGIRGDQTSLRGEMTGLRGEMTSLRGEMRSGLDLLTGKVMELSDRVGRLEGRLESH